MRRGSSGLILVTLLALGSLTACGDDDASTPGDPDGSNAAAGADCPVLQSEVSEVVGVEVGTPRAEGAGTGCNFEFNEGTSTVAVRVFRGTGEESHKAFLAAFDDSEELTVDGRDAAWAPSVGTLDIVDGDDGVQVQIVETVGDDIPDERQAAIDLAAVVLANL